MKLKRAIGLFEAIFYGVGIIVGAGIYALIGPAAGITGNSLWMSFLISAVIASFTALSYCELASMFPHAGAEYVYARRAFGSKFFAFIVGWLIVITGVISVAAVGIGFTHYLQSLIYLPLISTTLLLIAVLSIINYKGIKESSIINIVLVSIEIVGLLIIIFIGIPSFGKVNYLEMPSGFNGVLLAAALIFFAYIGFDDVVNIAEETRNPRKVIPTALIISIIVATLLYVLTSISVVSVVGWQELGASKVPLSLVASKAFGSQASLLITVIGLVATFSTVLVLLIVISRMMYGMAREKSLPKFLGDVHEKHRTPWMAVLITMILSMGFVFFGNLTTVANLTSLTTFITFIIVNISLIWMRYSMPGARRPFHAPLNIGKFSVIAFLGAASSLFMIFQFEPILLLGGLAILAAGGVIYFLFMKKYHKH